MNENEHTESDFANARFATHPDGRTAARLNPDDPYPWRISAPDGGWAREAHMAEEGWEPVREISASDRDRIEAWDRVAEHLALAPAYDMDGQTLIDAVIARLDELEEAEDDE